MKERLLRAYFTEGRNIGDPGRPGRPGRRGRAGPRRGRRRAGRRSGPRRGRGPDPGGDRPRHRRGADLRLRSAVVGSRGPGSGDVPAGAGAGGRAGGHGVRAGVTALHGERQGTGPRVVLVHGFTQTGRSWGPIGADLARDHEVLLVDAPGHGGSTAVRADLTTGGGPARRRRWPGDLRRLLDGRPAGVAPRPRPVRTGRRPRAPRRDGRDRGRARSGPPAAAPTRSGQESWSAMGSTRSSSAGWPNRCSPACRRTRPTSTIGGGTPSTAWPAASASPAPAARSRDGASSPA